jgi:tryptophanyl-tRNA synthetase
MKAQTIVSGMQPTSRLHIGNYLGALKQFVDLQNAGPNNCFFIIVDLHALTVPFEPKELRHNSVDLAATYIAAGLDPERSTIFIQSQVQEHAELAWILNCLTPLGELERMTQFKDKSGSHAQASIGAGLLNYPTLMAADILLYKPSTVPVGDDQTQHLELTRVLARKFNKQFGNTFPEPQNYMLKPLRIMSLKHPEKKMSKTNDEPLFLDEVPKSMHQKLKKAVTATDGSGASAGAENLMYLLSHFGTAEHIAYFADAKKDGSIKYSELKEALADDIANHFAEFREKKKELLARPEQLAEILGEGARKARAVASQTLLEVKEKIGLL